MRKFKSVNELVNKLKPDNPVYCIRPEQVKKSVSFFRENFPGKILYAVKTNPHEKIIRQIISNGLLVVMEVTIKILITERLQMNKMVP